MGQICSSCVQAYLFCLCRAVYDCMGFFLRGEAFQRGLKSLIASVYGGVIMVWVLMGKVNVHVGEAIFTC